MFMVWCFTYADIKSSGDEKFTEAFGTVISLSSVISLFSVIIILGGVWEQSFSAVLEEYCSILKYCSIIYIMVFGKLGKISVFKTEVLQIL
jgi:hypothetical protein